MPNEVELISGIFTLLYRNREGYICIATKNTENGTFKQTFFQYPDQQEEAAELAFESRLTHDVYFSPNLFAEEKATKDNVTVSTCIWADLDYCHPAKLDIAPSIVLESSKGRFQAFWLLSEELSAGQAEGIAKKIAYQYNQFGADLTGWNVNKLLRLPYTYNYKYDPPQQVALFKATEVRYTAGTFDTLEDVDSAMEEMFDFPAEGDIPDSDKVREANELQISPFVKDLIDTPPRYEYDWSKRLWQLELSLFEAGLTREEVFSIARDSACNKYKRDRRSDVDLWKEIVRAYWAVEHRHTDSEVHITIKDELPVSPLLSDEERTAASVRVDFVQEYTSWARGLSDAAWQYHEAGAFIILSTLLSGAVKLPTSFGTILPNLWFMILANTTLTRKSTAMDIAMDLLYEVDDEAILATDGSIEGLMEGMRTRPNRPSIFLRDEFTGLMEQVTKRDYYAGMLETLTKLYDGKRLKRVLKRETIEVVDPILILFAGGIKSKMAELISFEHVTSGFIPRFLFITAEGDLTKIKPVGPPRQADLTQREALLTKMNQLNSRYWSVKDRKIAGKISQAREIHMAELTSDAWNRYNDISFKMMQDALQSENSEFLTPTFDRMCISGLKAAVLLAAADCVDEPQIVVTLDHLLRAFYFIEKWREHTLYVIANLGMSKNERLMQNILVELLSYPHTTKATIMRKYKLHSAQADGLFRTLEERGLIKAKRQGRGIQYVPVNR